MDNGQNGSPTRNWNALIASLPDYHLLQTREWGQLKSRYGWRAFHLLWTRAPGEPEGRPEIHILQEIDQAARFSPHDLVAACQVLIRSINARGLPFQISLAYAPKGPLLDWTDQKLRQSILADLVLFSRRQGATFLKIDPDVRLGTGTPNSPDDQKDPLGHDIVSELQNAGWIYSQAQIQFKNTVILNLSPDEDDLLAGFKQKTRYNIRLAGRKGVSIRVGDRSDLDLLYQMYAETSLRDGFAIRGKDYYQDLWGSFLPASRSQDFSKEKADPMAEPLIAEVEGQAVAALIPFYFGTKSWYLYGMSTTRHRNLMPNYLLQWEAMRHAKQAGCSQYDLWGAPDEFREDDPMWGVYRFKSGFNGEVVRTLGAWDQPLRPTAYTLYTRLLPRILALMRRRGVVKTRRTADLS